MVVVVVYGDPGASAGLHTASRGTHPKALTIRTMRVVVVVAAWQYRGCGGSIFSHNGSESPSQW